METAETYCDVEGAEMFFEGKPQHLFQQLLTAWPERIVSADYLTYEQNPTLNLNIRGNGKTIRKVKLKYDPANRDYLIGVTESAIPAGSMSPYLILSLMNWQGRPLYTPALREDQHLVLGCSRRLASVGNLHDLHDLTIGLADAMEQIDTALNSRSVFPYLWSNVAEAKF